MKNYYKALDHQGINFKTSDRKAISSKALLQEIEVLYKEQREKRVILIASGSKSNVSCICHPHSDHGFAAQQQGPPSFSKHQMDFRFSDPHMFKEIRKLIMLQVSNTQTISQSDEDRIGEFLATFVRQFFFIEEFDDLKDMEEHLYAGADRAKKLTDVALSESAKILSASAEEQPISTKKGDQMDIDDESKLFTTKLESVEETADSQHARSSSPSRRPTYSFYVNNTFYVFFRLYQVRIQIVQFNCAGPKTVA
jgi:paired amphipathic helix protein Sin3a